MQKGRSPDSLCHRKDIIYAYILSNHRVEEVPVAMSVQHWQIIRVGAAVNLQHDELSFFLFFHSHHLEAPPLPLKSRHAIQCKVTLCTDHRHMSSHLFLPLPPLLTAAYLPLVAGPESGHLYICFNLQMTLLHIIPLPTLGWDYYNRAATGLDVPVLFFLASIYCALWVQNPM